MDLPAVCQKINDLDLFLQNEIPEKERKCRLDFLKHYAGPEYQYLEFNPNDSDHIILKKQEKMDYPKAAPPHIVRTAQKGPW